MLVVVGCCGLWVVGCCGLFQTRVDEMGCVCAQLTTTVQATETNCTCGRTPGVRLPASPTLPSSRPPNCWSSRQRATLETPWFSAQSCFSIFSFFSFFISFHFFIFSVFHFSILSFFFIFSFYFIFCNVLSCSFIFCHVLSFSIMFFLFLFFSFSVSFFFLFFFSFSGFFFFFFFLLGSQNLIDFFGPQFRYDFS